MGSMSFSLRRLARLISIQMASSPASLLVGVLLSSSNASTWTVHNEADLWFELIGCQFEPKEKIVPIGVFTPARMSDVVIGLVLNIPIHPLMLSFG